MTGHGLLLFDDGSVYDGEFAGDLQLQGRGMLVSPNGLQLDGWFQGAWGDRAGVKVRIEACRRPSAPLVYSHSALCPSPLLFSHCFRLIFILLNSCLLFALIFR